RWNEIIPCINCMECIERPVTEGRGTACAVNAATGRERAFRIQPVAKPKTVMVVGGGPAGMQSASVAARRGHKVALYEKSSELGGQLAIAKLPPHKEELTNLISYMADQLTRSGVTIEYNTVVTPDMILEKKPDAVIIAAGAAPLMTDMPGVKQPQVLAAQDVLAGRQVGQNVVIIGGGMVGCETGHFLSEKGKHVIVVEMIKRVANDMAPMVRRRLLDGLREKQVMMMTNTTCLEIKEEGILVKTADGKQQEIQADSVIIAVGYQKNDTLFQSIKDKVPEASNIGDSANPQRIREAILSGYQAGLSV
ncbi:MAG: FAD-dependent oxidoreductase, partial [Proteobacteria bacterium]|nr:FAD-dependent oxidoreductase [Pseudomonadota bacterium]